MSKNPIRDKNISMIKKLLFKNRSLFASDLVDYTNLSIVTINSLLKELVQNRFVYAQYEVQREFGRPATKYHFNYDRLKFLLISIVASHGDLFIYSYIVNLEQNVQQKTCDRFFPCTTEVFQQILSKQLAKEANIQKIAISIPGKVDEGIIKSSWYENFDQWPIDELIKSVTDIPYDVQNDVHLLTIGHCILENLSSEGPFVGIYFPPKSMPGISIFMKNTLIEGNHSLAGEAKYFPTFIDNGVPEDDIALLKRTVELVSFYNVALAPSTFILSIPNSIEKQLLEELNNSFSFTSHPNDCEVQFVKNFEKSILYGLQWLLFRFTPYDLTKG
ncbi:ROK family protein [Tetragenococcus osmophilus]|uniref:ROK family protein n=1 Tax=Tetragenococcus osmophilus TaxID=526944 RepID=A0AA37XNT1_9ENTE|nr:ROK family protein [Tetragenococcus osmophilus]GMA55235.1 hypothetical protein GCM10025857_65920 [Alicyclobacillus contaminans]AYW47148.1 ROK family protein [Tetragenococcus osmophilus]GMA55338.1 hypothetical protein GCM10025857_66950 [Alicyclobacillus contaminans]GMA70998.1 hypothetical protein GCM10025885_00470 [Tetragenococcus osmophilus]GMA73400.1 hypothetical protein GCM10025885_24490 [Tetragenococcus osmophilus]